MESLKSTEEDYVVYKIYPCCDLTKENKNVKIIELRDQCFEIVKELVEKYMWHHDHFVLDVNDSESFIGGKVTIGDSVEDEWFLISLLFKISDNIDDIVIQVSYQINLSIFICCLHKQFLSSLLFSGTKLKTSHLTYYSN